MNKETGKQAPIAELITTFASRVAEQAGVLSERLSGKLAPVMTSDKPSVSGCMKADTQREYPPLFEELRTKLQAIENALYGIENCLSRTEL